MHEASCWHGGKHGPGSLDSVSECFPGSRSLVFRFLFCLCQTKAFVFKFNYASHSAWPTIARALRPSSLEMMWPSHGTQHPESESEHIRCAHPQHTILMRWVLRAVKVGMQRRGCERESSSWRGGCTHPSASPLAQRCSFYTLSQAPRRASRCRWLLCALCRCCSATLAMLLRASGRGGWTRCKQA